jgi:hypothetical protein
MRHDSGVGERASGSRRASVDQRGAEHFAMASRDELWIHGTLAESRLMYGEAHGGGDVIESRDSCDQELVRACEDDLDAARTISSGLRDVRIRIVVRAAREDGHSVVETTMTIRSGDLSIVTTPADAVADYALLRTVAARNCMDPVASVPIVWQNGSASVLLHEAVGHAAEEGAAEVSWPPWLTVETPLVPRRATFRDVPLPRMTHLAARQSGAPFEMPETFLEVFLIDGGAYDPLNDMVTINVAASSCGRFTIRRSRTQIAAALRGATGQPIRYPGVICSREGQELYVASHAPVIVTDALT